MALKFSKNNTIIHYRKGQSRIDVIEELKKRVSKRQKELDKRKWIYDEYVSLEKKQDIDRSWIRTLELWTDERWNGTE